MHAFVIMYMHVCMGNLIGFFLTFFYTYSFYILVCMHIYYVIILYSEFDNRFFHVSISLFYHLS